MQKNYVVFHSLGDAHNAFVTSSVLNLINHTFIFLSSCNYINHTSGNTLVPSSQSSIVDTCSQPASLQSHCKSFASKATLKHRSIQLLWSGRVISRHSLFAFQFNPKQPPYRMSLAYTHCLLSPSSVFETQRLIQSNPVLIRLNTISKNGTPTTTNQLSDEGGGHIIASFVGATRYKRWLLFNPYTHNNTVR